MPEPLRLKLIACEIVYREVCHVVARSLNRVDVEFLPKGLHDMGQPKMLARLQEALAQVDESCYHAILLGYGLCNNGLVGLAARRVPLVVPRAHDCITLFLGSKERYLDYFTKHPGVYFKTTGWLERGRDLEQYRNESIQQRHGLHQSYDDLVAKYGEDNAKFLWEQLGDLTRNYSQITFIRMGIERDTHFEQQASEDACERNWKFELLDGNLSLLERLVDGPWDSDQFLVVAPGEAIAPAYDESIIKSRPGTHP